MVNRQAGQLRRAKVLAILWKRLAIMPWTEEILGDANKISLASKTLSALKFSLGFICKVAVCFKSARHWLAATCPVLNDSRLKHAKKARIANMINNGLLRALSLGSSGVGLPGHYRPLL